VFDARHLFLGRPPFFVDHPIRQITRSPDYTTPVPGEDILSLPPPAADLRVRYGPEPEQFADLRFARDRKTAPLAINIHGGFWRQRYDLTHAGHLCAVLAARGINTANLEYRRVCSPAPGTAPRESSWTLSLDDVRAAYAYLVQHASEFGIAAAPAVVLGHSAGGQLAFCLAAHESSVRNCISLAGVLDLRRAFQLHLSNDAVVEYLGGTPEQVPERYRGASPMELEIPSARQVIIHGLADDVVPIAISRDYAEAKKKRGEQVEFVPIAEASHMDVIDPSAKAFQVVAEAVLRLLGR
jgi:acetyl esterase/lipase